MQVTLNTQNNNQTGFTSLKKVNCGELLSPLTEDGFAIEDKLVQSLKSNKSFQTLCKKYDVYVDVIPHACRHVDNNKNSYTTFSILLDKILHLRIQARKIKNGGFLGLFTKKPPMEFVTGYKAVGLEAKTWSLANHIIDNFINVKDGLEADINKFLDRTV